MKKYLIKYYYIVSYIIVQLFSALKLVLSVFVFVFTDEIGMGVKITIKVIITIRII